MVEIIARYLNNKMVMLNSICRRIACNNLHNMILVAILAHPLANTATTICMYLFFASLGLTCVLLILCLCTNIPFSIAKSLCAQRRCEKIMGYGVCFALLTTRTFLFSNPLVNKRNSKLASKMIDCENLVNVQWLPNKVTLCKEDIDFRDGKQKT